MSAVAALVAAAAGAGLAWAAARRTELDRHEAAFLERGAARWNEGYAAGWTAGRLALTGELHAKTLHPTGSVHAEVVRSAEKVVDLEAWRLGNRNDGPGVA
jgi:hypothetical protein